MQYATGTVVSTPQGQGSILRYDANTKLYTVQISEKEVEMPRGDLLIQPASEGTSEEEKEEKETEKEEKEPPGQVEVDEPVLPPNVDLVFGGNNIYVFYRLYQLIYTRLQHCFELCQKELYTESNMTAHAVERALGEKKEEGGASPTAVDRNVELMDAMIHLLRGELTNQGFEQKCRQVLGTSGYFLYTIDRVVISCMRQVQNMMSDLMNVQLIVGV